MAEVNVSEILSDEDRHDNLLHLATRALRFKSLHRILHPVTSYIRTDINEDSMLAYCAARLIYPTLTWYMYNGKGSILTSTGLGEDSLIAVIRKPKTSYHGSYYRITSPDTLMNMLMYRYKSYMNLEYVYYNDNEDWDVDGEIVDTHAQMGVVVVKPYIQSGYTIDHIHLLLGEYIHDDEVTKLVNRMLDAETDMMDFIPVLKDKVSMHMWIWKSLILSIYAHKVYVLLEQLFHTYGMTELSARTPLLLPRMNKYQTGDIDFIFQ